MPLKVLITNLKVADRSGTEVVTEQLVDGLRRAGCETAVYTGLIGDQGHLMRARGAVVVDRLDALPWRPDIIHGHHNLPLMTALAGLPDTPAVFVCHDATAPHDAAPLHPRILRYLAVDEFCRQRLLTDGVAQESIEVLPNAVDEQRYSRRPRLPHKPRRALVVAKSPAHVAAVRHACVAADIALDVIGVGVGEISGRLEELYPRYDVVFASGRCALEAAFCGCAVIVCEGAGFAGLLTPDVLDEWRCRNLGRSLFLAPSTAENCAGALSRYDPSQSAEVADRLGASATLAGQTDRLIELYREIQSRRLPRNRGKEAKALSGFLEDHLPTFAEHRPWRDMARYIWGGEPPNGTVEARIARLVSRKVDETIDAVRALGPDAQARVHGARWLPAAKFYHLGGDLRSGALRFELAGFDGHPVFGPYEVGSGGRQEATFDLGWRDVPRDGRFRVGLEVAANWGEKVLASAVFHDEAPERRDQRTLVFECEPDDALEFRIYLAGFDRGALTFGGVLLTQAPLAPPPGFN